MGNRDADQQPLEEAASLPAEHSNEVSGFSFYTNLGQVGFKTERDGTITLDEAALNNALSNNYNAVNNLFTNQTGSTGVARRLYEVVDTFDDIEKGQVSVRKKALTRESKSLTEQSDDGKTRWMPTKRGCVSNMPL